MTDSGIFLIAVLAHFLVALPVCAHIVLKKTPDTAAIGWIAIVLLSPFIGSGLYYLFGINRIRRRAQKIRRRHAKEAKKVTAASSPSSLRDGNEQEREISTYARAVFDIPFTSGNAITPLIDGDQAYPDMLKAIQGAQESVALSVYNFEDDPSGQDFINALVAAHRRGITVRVLVDDIGRTPAWRTADDQLSEAGVTTACFITRSIRHLPVLNLRNHRKILLVDGQIAFTGGMNIRHGNVLKKKPADPTHDIHFRVEGPVINHLNMIFEEDWLFAANEEIALPTWPHDRKAESNIYARAVPAGPDDYFEKMQWVILGGISFARKSIHVLTPYFVPNEILSSALMVAAKRGVEVEVVIPRKLDIALMDWVMQSKMEALLENGVKIYRSRPIFDHSKVMVVDGKWSLVGSSNWDQRSLRLNFEANLECYDETFGATLEEYFAAKKANSETASLNDLRSAPLAIRLRNGIARLFSPYM